MTLRAGLSALALVLLFPNAGEGASSRQHEKVSLDVTRRGSAPSCPSEKELRREVTFILGYAPFDKKARKRLKAILWATDGTFHAHIEMKDARTHRQLGVRELSATGPTCKELGPAVALAIALAIDPLAQPPPARVVAAPSAPPTPAVPLPAPATAALGVGEAVSRAQPTAPPPRVSPQVATAPLPVTRPESPISSGGVDAGTALEAKQAADAGTAPDAGPEVDAGPALDAGTLAAATAVLLEPDGGLDAGLGATTAAPVDAGVPPLLVTPPPEAPPPVASAAAPVPSEEEKKSWHGLAGVGADLTLGLVPNLAFGVVAHGGVAFGFASVELEARWLPNTSLAFAPGSISSRLVTGGLVGCATFGPWGACGLVQTGPLTSQGHGYPDAQSHSTWVLELGARGQWDWVFAHPVGLRLHVDGLVNVIRPRLLVGAELAWEAPNFALAVGAGVFLVF